jgi:hypothetical protein
VDESAGHADAASALAAAGGAPKSSPQSPLVVVVNDPDRDTDSASALRAVRTDVGARPLRVVVATGSHVWDEAARAAHEAPLVAAAGAPTEVVWHDGAADANVAVGPARLDAAVAGARDVVGVGSVEPHWFAGLTGAHKTLTVGVMHRNDIAANHVLAMSADARPFRLEGNPVHEGLVRVLDALCGGRSVVALNSVGRRWFGGAPLDALAQASGASRARWRRTVARRFDFVVAVVDPPLSRTLYQAEKGIKNNEFAVADGGTILLDADCESGIGPDRFFHLLLLAPTEDSTRAAIERDGYRLGDHKAHRLRALQARGVRIGIVSPNFPRSTGAAAGLEVYASRDEAAAMILARAGSRHRGVPRGAVVENAGNMVVDVA